MDMFAAERKRMLEATQRSMAIVEAKRRAEEQGLPYNDGTADGAAAGAADYTDTFGQPAKKKKGKDCYFLVFMGLFLLNLPAVRTEKPGTNRERVTL
eukprot:SAG31_NODE_533_length_14371_cov_6.455367_1_plen_97_part_00